MKYREANFDGLVGPTHNYSGLSFGNVASIHNQNEFSNPKMAALQGLEKMYNLWKKGFLQGVIPPLYRPNYQVLRRLGFKGEKLSDLLSQAYKEAPQISSSLCSASSMWVANSVTQSPSIDTKDRKCHFTPANLVNKFHRSIEANQTQKIFESIFSSRHHFVIHDPLPAHDLFGDEGAANFTRFCDDYGSCGLELFVYGHQFNQNSPAPKLYPARQSLEASQAVARLHGLKPDQTIFAQQNPDVIDCGVFHNDVISVGNKNCFFYHEEAFLDEKKLKSEIQKKWRGGKFHFVKVTTKLLSVKDCVSSYLFNSQLLSLENSEDMLLLVPSECQKNPVVWNYIQTVLLKGDHPIKQVLVCDVAQSMKNGGGPACLRLRVVLSEEEIKSMTSNIWMNESLYKSLKDWIQKYYLEKMSLQILLDENYLKKLDQAFDDLSQILNLEGIY